MKVGENQIKLDDEKDIRAYLNKKETIKIIIEFFNIFIVSNGII